MKNENIKQYIVNYFFLFIVVFVIGYLFYIYSNPTDTENKFNLANPLGLQISYVSIISDTILMTIHNPNNVSVSFIVNIVGLRNDYGSTAAITHGGDIGLIITIPKNGYSSFSIPIYSIDPKNVVLQWEKLGGNLTISLYYEDINGKLSGIISTKIFK